MFDPSQLLAGKVDKIVESWMDIVREDDRIESARDLSDTALRNSLPILLNQLAKALSHPRQEDKNVIIDASVEHGTHRANEGFDAAEIAREYTILRRVIFTEIEPELLQCSPPEITRALDLINRVIDEAISQCFNTYVEARLQELNQIKIHLTLTNQELKRLVRANQDSLAYMAHELKTPLTAIIGFSDLFLRQQRQAVKSEDTVPNIGNIDRVLNSSRKLLHIVNDALELGRCEAGKMKLNPVSVEIRLVIEDVVATIEPLVLSKNLCLQVNCDRAPVTVVTDPFRLQAILTNLLSNAIRYTDEGSIYIKCLTLSDEKWSIEVTDTGIGIDPEDCDRIFEPYVQAFAKDLRRDKESTGLGLAIVYRIVKLLQGEIKVISQKGIGSTFITIFPLKLELDRTFIEQVPS